MAVAVVKHSALSLYATQVGFPLYTKVKCDSGLNGYQLWDKWIRENVQWVSQLGYDPVEHVKITESAQLVGELRNPWELRCQKFVEGTVESNTFKDVNVVEGEQGISTHVNRQAIQVAVSNASFKYKVDFETDPDGSVVTHNSLAVAIFDKAEDSSLSYGSDIEVAQLWTTKVEHLDSVDEHGESYTRPVLFKRAYADEPTIETSYPWIKVGTLTAEEYIVWKTHNVVAEATLEEGTGFDVRAIDETRETFSSVSTPRNIAEILSRQVPESIPAFITPAKLEAILRDKSPAEREYFNEWVVGGEVKPTESFTAISTPANISTEVKSGYERDYACITVSYPDSDDSGVSGDVND